MTRYKQTNERPNAAEEKKTTRAHSRPRIVSIEQPKHMYTILAFNIVVAFQSAWFGTHKIALAIFFSLLDNKKPNWNYVLSVLHFSVRYLFVFGADPLCSLKVDHTVNTARTPHLLFTMLMSKKVNTLICSKCETAIVDSHSGEKCGTISKWWFAKSLQGERKKEKKFVYANVESLNFIVRQFMH